MITININNNDDVTKYTVTELKELLREQKQQAFIAVHGDEDELFLITYYGIVMLKDPQKTWSAGTFRVKRFVNLNIRC